MPRSGNVQPITGTGINATTPLLTHGVRLSLPIKNGGTFDVFVATLDDLKEQLIVLGISDVDAKTMIRKLAFPNIKS